MMNIEELKYEKTKLTEELTEFYKQNSLTEKIKNNIFIKYFIALFIPYYDKNECYEYSIFTHIFYYFLYCILNLFVLSCFIKLGYDFSMLSVFLILLFICQMYLNYKLFYWQAIVTNLFIYIFAVYIVTTNVMTATIKGNYHKTEVIENMNINNFLKYNLLKTFKN